MTLTLKEVARHRNGICGVPFTVVLFDDAVEGRMVAIIFDSDRGSPRCAVLRVSTLAEDGGTVAFGVNSWRGDQYADALMPLVAEWEAAKRAASAARAVAASADQPLAPAYAFLAGSAQHDH